MSLFSVVIPTFNRLALLEKALGSIFVQTFGDYETIVVDDGSTDDTWKYLQSLGSQVLALRQDNRGPGAARNLGARRAKGNYLAFLDSDDLLFPWTLAVYASVIQKTKSPSFLAGKPWQFRGNLSPETVHQCNPVQSAFPDYLASGEVWRWWGASSFVIERFEFYAVGGFGEENNNCEDADLALRLGTSPGFVQVHCPSTFAYRLHDGNATLELGKSITGANLIVRSEQSRLYPGGPGRAKERRVIITRHLRAIAVDCARAEKLSDAWNLYMQAWVWNFQELRFRFLAGFPILTMQKLLGAPHLRQSVDLEKDGFS